MQRDHCEKRNQLEEIREQEKSSEMEVRLTSENFPFDAIIARNERVVKSARQTIEETRAVLMQVMKSAKEKEKVHSAHTVTSPNNSYKENVRYNRTDVEPGRRTTLPHISQFIKPLVTYNDRNYEYDHSNSSYEKQVLRNFEKSAFRPRFENNFSTDDKCKNDYRQQYDAYMNRKGIKAIDTGSRRDITPYANESSLKDRTANTSPHLMYQFSNGLGTQNQNEAISSYTYQHHLKEKVKKYDCKKREEDNEFNKPNLINFEHSLVKEIESLLAHQESSTKQTLSYSNFTMKENNYEYRKENVPEKSSLIVNFLSSKQPLYDTKKFTAGPVYKENHTTNNHKQTSNRNLQQKEKKRGYLCNECGKVYCRKYVLKIHQRVHSGEKPLSCKVCGKCFSDPSNMKKHVKLHDHEPASFFCKFCRRQFMTKKGLFNHLHCVHSRELVNDNN